MILNRFIYYDMRIWLVIIVLIFSSITSTAQTISRRYDGVSMSQALADIAKVSDYYKINFIYDELDEFPVICHFSQKNIIEAILSVIGHYPVKLTISGQHLFVECVEKRQTKVRGRVLGARSAPLPNANITVFDAHTGERIGFGVSNEGGEFSIPCDSIRIRIKISHISYKPYFKTCQAGKLGTIMLLLSNQELQNVVVTPMLHEKPMKINSSYKRKANKIREQIWNDNDSAFNQTSLDDSLRHYSFVSLAESFLGEYDRRQTWNPLKLFTNIFVSGANAFYTTSRQVVHRRVILNDSAAVERYSLIDYPKRMLSEGNKNLNVVMGVRVINPNGSISEIDTDPYTQPIQHVGEQRPDKIHIPQLSKGCIIDYFTWLEQKNNGINPPPFFIQTINGFPVLHSQIKLSADKDLSIQYRRMENTPKLLVSIDRDGSQCLSGQADATIFGNSDTTFSYSVYVRDPKLNVNRPLNALKHHIIENPSLNDIVNTTSNLYKQMCLKESSGEWASAYWNKADTTIIGLKVDNNCQISTSRPQLEQHLYEMVLNDPSYHTFDWSLTDNSIRFNREYTEKLAYTFGRANIPYRLAMSTRSDRENILELMDEENIVWMLVTERGKCYIPFPYEEMSINMVGRKATTTSFTNIFTIQ